MAKRANELGLHDDGWDEVCGLNRLKSAISYAMDFDLDPDHSVGLSVTPRGPVHRYIGDGDEEVQGASGLQ